MNIVKETPGQNPMFIAYQLIAKKKRKINLEMILLLKIKMRDMFKRQLIIGMWKKC